MNRLKQLFITLPFLTTMALNSTAQKQRSFLALGDSYTIGEAVSAAESFPYQLKEALLKQGHTVESLKIIAQTGWTTDELQTAIAAETLSPPYDLVTLLIGVNNQYRGYSVANYRVEFEQLLRQAIAFAGDDAARVRVLSIPDWGVTPFATQKGVDPIQVANGIAAYNQAKKEICEKQGIQFIDITDDYRINGGSTEGVVEDQLHPSKLIYEQWTGKLLSELKKMNF